MNSIEILICNRQFILFKDENVGDALTFPDFLQVFLP